MLQEYAQNIRIFMFKSGGSGGSKEQHWREVAVSDAVSTKLHAIYDSSSELARLQAEYSTATDRHCMCRYFHRMVRAELAHTLQSAVDL